jgi:hypothetical protein
MPRKAKGPYLKFLKKRDAYYIHWTRGDGTQGTRSTGTNDPVKAEAAYRRFMAEDLPGIAVKKRFEAPSCIYFIGGDIGAIKIGLSTDPAKRLAALQCGSPIPLRILAVGIGDRTAEWMYHTVHFGASRLHGEWFERTPELLAEIDRINALRPDNSDPFESPTHFPAAFRVESR